MCDIMDNMPAWYKTDKERADAFWSKVSIGRKAECWMWTGAKDTTGYGRTYFIDKVTAAHRVAWELTFNKTIPHGLFACHKCDVRPCCNPHHIFIGTNSDNIRDCVAKGLDTGRVRGSKIHCSKLTEVKVKEIRKLRNAGTTYRLIAEQFGISTQQTWCICSRRWWKHVK